MDPTDPKDKAPAPPEKDGLLKAGRWKIPASPPPDEPGGISAAFQPPPIETPATPPPTGKDTGDFTRMFKIPDTARVPQAPPPPAQVPTPPPAQQPGEFTRMFKPDEAAPVPPQPTQQAGEFTRMFKPPEAAPTAPVPPSPPPAQRPGEFTRMFKADEPAPRAPVAPPATSPPSSGAGEFTRFFRQPMQERPFQESPAQKPAAPVLPATPDPGAFTRVFGSPTPSGTYAPAAASAHRARQRNGSFFGPNIGSATRATARAARPERVHAHVFTGPRSRSNRARAATCRATASVDAGSGLVLRALGAVHALCTFDAFDAFRALRTVGAFGAVRREPRRCPPCPTTLRPPRLRPDQGRSRPTCH